MSRDFRELTPEELAEWNSIKAKEVISEITEIEIRRSMYDEYPEGVRRYLSLFPNHCLDIMELRDGDRIEAIKNKLHSIIVNENSIERDILNFINQNDYYFVIGSLLNYFNFGHHEAHCFKEFPLGTTFKADYLLLGLNSDGWHFAFVELEAPHGQITTKNGDLGHVFRKGISQVDDWKIWLQKNFSNLKEYFSKHAKNGAAIHDNFCHFDPTRIHYIVVAGRRHHFSGKTYQISRNEKINRRLIIHYDNLIDTVDRLKGKSTY